MAYLPATRAVDAARGVPAVPTSGRVSPNVVALGLVSLVTDISSEMVTSVLPVYLVFGLGVSLTTLGFVDGLYAGVTVVVSLLGAHFADRSQNRKAVAGVGYGLSAVSKLGLLAVGASVGGIAAVIGADRTGKGLRTAPRDALISLSSPPDSLGRAFGVHRAMDTAGALCGPLLAFVILWRVAQDYDAVFVVSSCIALAGVVLLIAFVRNHRQPVTGNTPPSLRAGLGLLRQPGLRRVCIQAAVLQLVTISDAFVYLLLQHRLGVSLAYFPLLPIGTAAAYMLLAVPAGRVADRTGRWRVFLAGNVAMVAVYVALLSPLPGSWLLGVALGLHGLYYACTSGVLMAVVSPSLPATLRTSGLAIVQTATAAGAFFSSLAIGAAWSWQGPTAAVWLCLGGLVTAVGVVTAMSGRTLLRPRDA